jgi:hypothetical protein
MPLGCPVPGLAGGKEGQVCAPELLIILDSEHNKPQKNKVGGKAKMNHASLTGITPVW